MNFEKIEINTVKHIIQHYSKSPLNTDYSYLLCYPPTLIDTTQPTFKNFWFWISHYYHADTYLSYTVTAFNLYCKFFLTELSEYKNQRLNSILIMILSSIKYKICPFSAEIIFEY